MAKISRVQPKTRLNLEIPEATKENLERLRNVTHAESKTEVIRRALALYDFLWSVKETGDTAIIRSKDGKERELVLL
ncbi:MAG: ribbon-helix-helix protein, CopG family [Methylococcales bacterium]